MSSIISGTLSKGILHFYTTQMRLNKPIKLNDAGNTCFSYVQYFTRKEIIQNNNGKIERLPNKVEDNFPLIPSALKSFVYFIAAISAFIIGTKLFIGTTKIPRDASPELRAFLTTV